jgi:hypothetical protein
MNRENATCPNLLELMMKALDNDTLKWLLATVQQINLHLRMEMMLKRYALHLNDFMFA